MVFIKDQKIKNLIFMFMSMIFLFSAILNPLYIVKADKWTIDGMEYDDPDKENEENNKKKEDFLNAINDEGYGNSVDSYGEKLNKEKYKKIKDDTVKYYIQYIFGPSHYIEDVNKAEVVKGAGDDFDEFQSHVVNGRKSVCYWNKRDQTLLSHNCDVPSFGTELFQTIFKNRYPTGVQGAERTSAVSNFGIPKGLSKNGVPVEPEARGSKFSALELFGYYLPYTVYNGEWDDIQVSTSTRLLSNVGFWQKTKLGFKSALNGGKNLLNGLIDDIIMGPEHWFRKKPGFVDGAVSTVIDTSDYYVIGTHGWKRPFFNNTLYNAYYLTDKEVIDMSMDKFRANFQEEFFKLAKSHPRLEKVINFAPEYNKSVYKDADLDWADETHWPEYDYMGNRDCKEYEKDSEGHETSTCAIWETEEEYFERWKKEDNQVKFDKEAKEAGIQQECFKDSKTYDELVFCWVEPWYDFSMPELNQNLNVIKQLMTHLTESFWGNNRRYDVNQSFSHYVQADEDGEPLGGRLDKSKWELLYEKDDAYWDKAKLAAGAKPVRPSIKGALFGNGEKESDDDRYLHFLNNTQSPAGNISAIAKLNQKITIFFTKITNELISISFDNIVSKLKLDVIVNKSVESMMSGIFFPLAALFVVINCVYTFAKFSKYPRAVFNSILWMVGVFIFAAAIMSNPGKIIEKIESVPNKIDNFLADIILFSTNDSELCTATGEDAAIRQTQCYVWQMGVFEPWLQGQWGVSNYEDLNIKNFNNQNSDLVGDAAVNMGGNVIENNWGLYQLSKMKVGTITTPDYNKLEGTTSKAMYQLVDLQVGPKHSKLSDKTYFTSWAGSNTNYRNTIQFFAMLCSFMMVIVIGGMSVAKISITMQMLIKFLFLPIQFLKSLGPNSKQKFMQTLNEWGGLFSRRIFTSVLLLTTLAVFQSIMESSVSYIILSIFMIIYMLLILWYKEELLAMMAIGEASVDAGFNKIKQSLAQGSMLPRGMRQRINEELEGTKAGVTGALAGAGVGAGHILSSKLKGEKNAMTFKESATSGWNSGYRRASNVSRMQNRRMGYSLLRNMAEAEEAAVKATTNNIDRKQEFTNEALSDTTLSKINLMISAKMGTITGLKEDLGNQERIEEVEQEIVELKEIQQKLKDYKYAKMTSDNLKETVDYYNKCYNTDDIDKRREAIYNLELDNKFKNLEKSYSRNFNQDNFNNDIDKTIEEMLVLNRNAKNNTDIFIEPAENPKVKLKKNIRNTIDNNIVANIDRLKDNVKTDNTIIEEQYNRDLDEYYKKLIIESHEKYKDNPVYHLEKEKIENISKENKIKNNKQKIIEDANLEDNDIFKKDDIFKKEKFKLPDLDEVDKSKENKKPITVKNNIDLRDRLDKTEELKAVTETRRDLIKERKELLNKSIDLQKEQAINLLDEIDSRNNINKMNDKQFYNELENMSREELREKGQKIEETLNRYNAIDKEIIIKPKKEDYVDRAQEIRREREQERLGTIEKTKQKIDNQREIIYEEQNREEKNTTNNNNKSENKEQNNKSETKKDSSKQKNNKKQSKKDKQNREKVKEENKEKILEDIDIYDKEIKNKKENVKEQILKEVEEQKVDPRKKRFLKNLKKE